MTMNGTTSSRVTSRPLTAPQSARRGHAAERRGQRARAGRSSSAMTTVLSAIDRADRQVDAARRR